MVVDEALFRRLIELICIPQALEERQKLLLEQEESSLAKSSVLVSSKDPQDELESNLDQEDLDST